MYRIRQKIKGIYCDTTNISFLPWPLNFLLVHLSRRSPVIRLSVVKFPNFQLLWNCKTEFYKTWQEARTQCPLPSLCFWDQLENKDVHPNSWLAEAFKISPLLLQNGIRQNLTGIKNSMPFTKFRLFQADLITKMAASACYCLRHFPLLHRNHWTELDNTWQEARTQCPLTSLCFSGWLKTPLPRASDLLRHFSLSFYNHWMEFNENWKEAKT